ncbi:hypothetical protein WR25_24940 [Diploscapter pachys]|uniref:Uncharacterized protein n=1 Tax=Diploscapter pachys TaxID=2018661 RepID=A0A2A2J2T2_9BILA|nr:hypothetical protein WR25_24940 [Diploscapter pachys]
MSHSVVHIARALAPALSPTAAGMSVGSRRASAQRNSQLALSQTIQDKQDLHSTKDPQVDVPNLIPG